MEGTRIMEDLKKGDILQVTLEVGDETVLVSAVPDQVKPAPVFDEEVQPDRHPVAPLGPDSQLRHEHLFERPTLQHEVVDRLPLVVPDEERQVLICVLAR